MSFLPKNIVTLTTYILRRKNGNRQLQSDLTQLFSSLTMATKIVSNALERAGIEKLFGCSDLINNEGEQVPKLDVLANEAFRSSLSACGLVCAMCSESDEDVLLLESAEEKKYVVCFDPLDGSCNLDASVTVGTIFGIYERKSRGSQRNYKKKLPQTYKIVQLANFLFKKITLEKCSCEK